MPNRCTWIDSVEFEPLEGGTMHFTFISGDEEMRFCMSREAAARAAYNALAHVEQADMAETLRPSAEVVRLR